MIATMAQVINHVVIPLLKNVAITTTKPNTP